jgi:hypothetical protein
MSYFSELAALEERAMQDLAETLDRFKIETPIKDPKFRAQIEAIFADLILGSAAIGRGHG